MCARILSAIQGAWSAVFIVAILLSSFSPAQDFTIIVLPDTQNYSAYYPATLPAQTQWIAANVASLNIKSVVGAGDVVNGGGEPTQWQTASAAYHMLDGTVPYFVAMGNHDYNANDPQHRTLAAGNFNTYFGPSRYAIPGSGYGGSFIAGSNENFWGSVVINNQQYIFLVLEFYPRMSALQWAAGVIRANPAAEVILVTHAYGYNDSTRIALCDQYNAESYGLGNDNDGDETWANLASQFPNVTLVLSGHIVNGSGPSQGHMTEPGTSGNTVNEMMADYEKLAGGGSGYLRILTFQPGNNQIVVSTYSPTLNAYLTDSGNSFTVPWHATSKTGTGTIKGRLKTDGCSAIAGATVSYGGVSATTDSGGNYTLRSVPAGTASLNAVTAGFPAISKQVSVVAGLTSTMPLYMSAQTGTVTGFVKDGNTGLPVSGTVITSNGSTAASDVDGSYTLAGLPAVSTQLTATASGYPALTRQISVSAGKIASLDFLLDSTPIGTNGSVMGAVTNSQTGDRIANATVNIGTETAVSAADGTFSLSGIPAGAQSLIATAQGMYSLTVGIRVIAGGTIAQNMNLKPLPGVISGQITNASTGAGISSATVSISGASTTTSSSGAYKISGVTPGTYTVTATKTGWLTRSSPVTVLPGGVATVNLSLATAGKISGAVKDASGALEPGVTVAVSGGVIPTTVVLKTNSAGVYTTNWIPVGGYSVTVSQSGHSTVSATCQVNAGATTTLNFSGF